MFEVAKVVDLNRLLGGAVGADIDQMASDTCTAEFRSFTGLGGSTEDLWLTTLTTTGGNGAIAVATCIVASRAPRVGSARGIAQ